MKRFIKFIIPIMLVIAIIASIGWYLFDYDREFTQQQLVKLARWCEAEGNQEWAIQLYGMAYEHSDQNSHVAIELAEMFRQSGNYTKAEYTLSNAIADGGSIDLYVALCKIFVEQNKLMDAVNMLDSVSDPVIKSQLDSMRPAAPVATPEQGKYSERFSVSFLNTQGKVYATAERSFPSIADGPCASPIPLSPGSTTIYALTVGDNGLVSTLQIYSYIISGVIEPVTLSDEAIDQTVRQLLQVDENHILYSNELWELESLIVPSDAESLADFSLLPNLTTVAIHSSSITDLSPLESLVNLTELSIKDTPVSPEDLSFIAKLPKLTSLTLSGCGLSSIANLAPATSLTYLDLNTNSIRDTSALSDMSNLEYVDLSHNALTDLRIFRGKEKLTELYVSYNSILSTTPLIACPALSVLDVTSNQLTSLDGVDGIPQLRTLYAAYNQLTDVSALASCSTLGDLDISYNQISNIDMLSTLNQLLIFNFSNNQISRLPNFAAGCSLSSITGTSNDLTSLDALSGLKNLNFVYVDKNPALTSIAPLAKCYNLIEVNVLGTGITDVSALRNAVGEHVTIHYSSIAATEPTE
ncbi:MAG: leucine-rich repeat domain-containing protein [Ruminococcaceae bacterium]|nr:leucine-rich repeat domain-containing protein [Oscillospiraceae bacterium]